MLIFLVRIILKKLETSEICPPHLQTLATLPLKVQNSDFSAIFNNDFD